MSIASSAPWEHVADLLPPGYVPPERCMTDRSEARRRVADYLKRRLAALLESLPGQPVLMLSGGIDSVTLAAALRALEAPPLCVTVAAASQESTDRDRAVAVANQLELEHHAIELSDRDIQELVSACVERIGTDELWEVGAAVPIRAVFDWIGEKTSAVFSGAGADVLFAGGLALDAPPYSLAGRTELRQKIWQNVLQAFRYERLVPDFFDRLLDSDASRFCEVFQTVEAWHATADFAPEVLYSMGPGNELVDKMCLRDLAVELGVDHSLVWAKKDPMQLSSGITAAFAACARKLFVQDPAASTYSNPAEESMEVISARLWLRHVGHA